MTKFASKWPEHPVFIREEFFGLIFYNTVDKSYYFFQSEEEKAIDKIISGYSLNSEEKEFEKELLEAKLLSTNITRIRRRRDGQLSAPLRLFIDITKTCNLRCAHCFTDSGCSGQDELSTEEVKYLLRQMKEMGTFLISIAGGEPLLRKDLIELIEEAKNLQIDVSLTTNGTKVTPEIAEKLGRLNIRTLTVSLDGTKETHEEMRGKGNFERALNGIRLLKQFCKSTTIALKTTVNNHNIEESEDLIRIAEGLGIDSLKFNPIRPFGRACDHPHLLIDRDQYIAFLEKVQKIPASIEVGVPKTPLDRREYEFIPIGFGCTGGKETCNVAYNGEFSACAFLGSSYVVGNVKTSLLSKLWTETNLTVDYVGNETCNTCSGYAQCRGGCRNRACYEYGNRDGIDPLCVLKKAIPREKLTIRQEPSGFLIYDHRKGQYLRKEIWEKIAEDYPILVQNKQYRKIELSFPTPLKIFFDPTLRCNSKCIHCYSSSTASGPPEMSLLKIEKLASEMASLGIMQAALAGGEPFMRKDIHSILTTFQRYWIDTSITTNGILFKKEIFRPILATSLRTLTISIDGISRERYFQIRGIDALQIVLNNLADFKLQQRKNAFSLAMRYSVMQGSESPEEVLSFAVAQGFDCLKVNKTHALGRFIEHEDSILSDQDYDAWIEKLREQSSKFPIEVELPREKYFEKDVPECSAGKKTMYVSSEGDVFSCPFTKQFYFGNINSQHLSQIVENAQNFSTDNPYCRNCPAMNKSHGISQKRLVLI